jgi:hypothetical protein
LKNLFGGRPYRFSRSVFLCCRPHPDIRKIACAEEIVA